MQETIDIVCQIMLGVFGVTAIWFVGRKETWRRWGYVCGLCAQPFWFYSTIKNEQWSMVLLSVIYTCLWVQGFYNHWIKK